MLDRSDLHRQPLYIASRVPTEIQPAGFRSIFHGLEWNGSR